MVSSKTNLGLAQPQQAGTPLARLSQSWITLLGSLGRVGFLCLPALRLGLAISSRTTGFLLGTGIGMGLVLFGRVFIVQVLDGVVAEKLRQLALQLCLFLRSHRRLVFDGLRCKVELFDVVGEVHG